MREGSATDVTKCHWYGGKLTKKEVEARLGADECSTSFLVWQSAPDQLTLSTKTQRLFCHTGIINSPEGFYLDTSEMTFKTLTDLIGYYGLSGEPKISTGTYEKFIIVHIIINSLVYSYIVHAYSQKAPLLCPREIHT